MLSDASKCNHEKKKKIIGELSSIFIRIDGCGYKMEMVTGTDGLQNRCQHILSKQDAAVIDN